MTKLLVYHVPEHIAKIPAVQTVLVQFMEVHSSLKIAGFTVNWHVHSSTIPHSSMDYAMIHVTRELTNGLWRVIVRIMG